MKKCFLSLSLLFLIVACTEAPTEINISKDIDKALPPLAEIYAPLDEDTLPANQPFTLDYAVVRGSSGAYVEIQVDKMKPHRVVLTDGHHLIAGLPPGRHRIAVVEYNNKGKPTGAHAAVNITVE